MKLLLDENIPRQLKRDIINHHEVFTVREKQWDGKLNGALLTLMLAEGFEALVTADKNLQHQQNFNRYPIPVLVLRTYRITYEDFKPLVPRLLELLKIKRNRYSPSSSPFANRTNALRRGAGISLSRPRTVFQITSLNSSSGMASSRSIG